MSEQLIKACKEGDLKAVQELLSKSADINYKDENGMTALLCAAECGHLLLVKYLLTEANPKASMTEKNTDEETALLLAAINGHIEILKYLLTEATPKASLAEKNNVGSTALLLAAANGRTKILQYLLTEANPKASLTEKNDHESTALLLAALNGQTETLKYLLTEANPKASLAEKEIGGNTALHVAAYFDHIHTIKYLLTEANPKANINERNKDGDSPLAISVWRGFDKTVAYLLSQGAYIEIHSNDSNTSLQKLEKERRLNAITLLKAAENLINAAAEKGNKGNILSLSILGNGVNACSMNKNGNTALHLAIINENINIILLLLEAGASLDITNHDEFTPYNLAIMSKNPFINTLGYLFKAKQILNEILLQFKDSKNQKDKNIVKELGKPTIESLDSAGLEIKCHTEQAEMKNIKDIVAKEMEVDHQSKGNAEKKEKAEKLKSELETTLSKAIECFETLEEIDKQEMYFQLGSFLAAPENAPLDAVRAYEVLIQVNKSNQEFAKCNALIYRMLLGKHLLLARTIKSNGLGLKVEQEIIPIDPNDEGALKQESDSQELTLRAVIQHLLYSGLKDEPLKNYLAAYTLGNDNGIAAEGLNDFQHFQDPESCLTFIDAMRKENLALKRKIKVQENEIEALKATLAALGVGSGVASAAPLLIQFQSSTDADKASAKTSAKVSDQCIQLSSGSDQIAKFQ